MPRHRLSFTERRRANLRTQLQLALLEERSLITEPLNLSAVSLGIPLVGNVITSSDGGGVRF